MDSFFKAAVCDLDKLLDDFELNTGKTYELICSLFSQLMKTLISCLSNVQKTERKVCYGSPEIVDI